MKYRVAIILASASAAALAAPAAAQDNESFTGPRVEVIFGYDESRPGSSEDFDNVDDIEQSIYDVAYGVGVGYDFAFGGAVVGVEGEYLRSEAQTTYNTVGFEDFGVGNIDTGRDLYVGLRAGILATPNTLVYAKGGYTNARYKLLATDNTTDIETNANLDGWRVGAGLEHSFNGNLYAKAEYRYSNYSNGEFEFPNGATTADFDVDVDRHQVMAGIGLRF